MPNKRATINNTIILSSIGSPGGGGGFLPVGDGGPELEPFPAVRSIIPNRNMNK